MIPLSCIKIPERAVAMCEKIRKVSGQTGHQPRAICRLREHPLVYQTVCTYGPGDVAWATSTGVASSGVVAE